MKLRSKCAVTLYEEAYADHENKTLIAPVEDVRSWLKVPEEAADGVWRNTTGPRLVRSTPQAAACSAALRPWGRGSGRRASRQDFDGLRRVEQRA